MADRIEGMSSKARILVLQPDKGLAESIYRALCSIPGFAVEVDVALLGDVRIPGVQLDRYDLLIADRSIAESDFVPPFMEEVSGGEPLLPVITVGGAPTGTPRTGAELFRVPLPLSFNLLEESVRAALAGIPDEEEEDTPRKDSVG